MNSPADTLVALDLGSSRTRALVAEVLASGEGAAPLRVLGFGEVESEGWRRAAIADLGLVTASVRKAVQLAEAAAGVSVESAMVGVGGPHIQGLSARGRLLLASRPREVTREDVRRVIEAARSVSLPRDREILHMIPQEFVIDSQGGIRDPLAMQGSSLEVEVHIVTGSAAASQNVVTAVNRAGILVETLVLEGLAIGEAVVTPEEAELGTAVIIVGAASSQWVAYRQGGLRMSGEISIGGDHFTNDLAIGLHTSLPDAEMVKRTFGSVYLAWGQGHEGSSFEVPGVGDRPSRQVPRRALLEILEPRGQELFGFVLDELRRCGIDQQLGAGVILAGGGARLQGMCDLAEQIFAGPARLALPPKISGLPDPMHSPEYATLVSLLLYGQRVRRLRAPKKEARGSWWGGLLRGGKRDVV